MQSPLPGTSAILASFVPNCSSYQLIEGVLMSHVKHIRFLFAIALLIATVPFPAFAQSSNGSVSGTATDDAGAVLPGVTITALNTATGLSRNTTSNPAGHYDI